MPEGTRCRSAYSPNSELNRATKKGRSGRGPTSDMSPRKTLNSCGNSSSESRRIQRPMVPRRASSATDQVTAASASSSGRRLRNFRSSNWRPSRPMRCWRKMTPGPLSRRTSRAQVSSTGESRTTASVESTRSRSRLQWPGQGLVGGPTEADQRDTTHHLAALGASVQLPQARHHEDGDPLAVEGAGNRRELLFGTPRRRR